MNINKAIIYAVVTSLIYLCSSGQVHAYQLFDNQANNHDVDIVSLLHFYKQPSDYLWLEQNQLKIKAYDALEFIARSVDHGLNPNDYHHELLEQLAPTHDESEARLFDLMLTDGVLKLVRDISTGRLNPSIVDPKWSIPRKPFNAVTFLQDALLTDDFKASLVSLIPSSVQYQQLKMAAERYQRYVSSGGWVKIPNIPALHPGDFNQSIPIIRDRLTFADDTLKNTKLSQSKLYDEKLKLAVQQFQQHHGLKADGLVGPSTIRAMNVSAAVRLQQININLERLRWLPDDLGERYIMVNLANFQLSAIEDDEVKLNMRVIVGKSKRSTPSFSSKMTHVVFNPLWYIPHKLARLDLLPKQQANPNYFERYNIRVFSKHSGYSNEIQPDAVDWHALSEYDFPYSLRQDPGDKNSLGRLKFVLLNPWAIYLHDTPSKSLFNQTQRNFSSGCIRVENPLALANFSMSSNFTPRSSLDISNNDDTYSARLEQPLTVYAIYATVWHNGDNLMFSPDSYQRDQKMAQYL